MENLKKLIKQVENQSRIIKEKRELIELLNKRSNPMSISADGYRQISLIGERKNKIKELIESFLIEDEKLREPLADKLNIISRLIGSGE